MTPIESGWPVSFGCAVGRDGARFAVFSRNASRLWLMLFDEPRAGRAVSEIEMDPQRDRIGDVWATTVAGVRPGQLYAYRADGPYEPGRGLFFNPDLLLLDPYARAVTDGSAWASPGFLPGAVPPGDLSRQQRESLWAAFPKCVVVDSDFEWGGDRPLRRPLTETVIYEVHVRGFTADPRSRVRHAGTYAGLVEKIPYLRQLGITAVELLPVQEFDERENPRVNPSTGERLTNYWGYSPMAFFAPEGRYSDLGAHGQQVDAFKSMVKALHDAEIEVILDVVFNHTAEGDQRGPTVSLRGLDNRIYYMLSDGGARYLNLTGCGNTVNCNHPVVRTLIRDCLRYWVVEMHVDGFRFDLASVLGRDVNGELLENPPLIELITEDPLLSDTKLIAEAWDAAGAYQVGSFPGVRWSEWNGRFRDDVRRFWLGDAGMLGTFATRLSGSADLYEAAGRTPQHSINFVTSHDGFTLRDMVSYARRHNEANAEANRDGCPAEHSANHGHEGETDDPRVQRVRDRQVRNLLLSLLMSQGVPMLLAGDEMGRTQRGNNNAYCHDDETSWIDWAGVDESAELVRFTRELIALRARTPAVRRDRFLRGGAPRQADVAWFGPDGHHPRWTDPESRAVGCMLESAEVDDQQVVLLFNAADRPVTFCLPPVPQQRVWVRAVDTGKLPPDDIRSSGDEALLDDPERYGIGPRTSAVLVGQRTG